MSSIAVSPARYPFKMGIRKKLITTLVVILLAALTFSGWMVLRQERINTLQEINQRGSDISRFVAKSLSYSVVGYDYHTIQLLLNEITSGEEIGYARVSNRKGKVMGESGKRLNQSANMVIFTQPIKLDESTLGELVLGLSTEKIIRRLEQHKYEILLREGFIVLLIALGQFFALSYFIIRPVRLISQSLSRTVDKDGHVGNVPVISRDEFGHLAESFNALGQQLNAANNRLQSKIEMADNRLLETNRQLREQSRELKTMNENFKRLSITDSLTGLCNRRHFEELIQTEIETGQRHGDANSLIIFDIDHFKAVNDNYGHPGGDAVLRDIAIILKRRMRTTDFLCRIGGEEFAVLCKRTNKTDAIQLAEELRLLVEATTITHANKDINVTISLGIATAGPDCTDNDSEIIYQHADQAVYYSKEHGRNQHTHYDDIKTEVKNS